MPNPVEQDPRVYFAAERTLLAWIRTGLALMGFGFAIARFGLFLREFQATQITNPTAPIVHKTAWGSPITGVTLLVMGIIVTIAASLQYVRIIRQLRTGTWIPGELSTLAITLAILLALVGTAMAIYLLLIH